MSRAAWGRIFLLIALLAATILAVLYRDQIKVDTIDVWINEAGPAAPLLFMAFYALGTTLFLPGSVLTLAGGALFGPFLGTFYNLTAATIGAGLSFLAARHLAGDWVGKKSGGWTRQLIKGVESEGWRFVAFTRLVPLFPFNLLNYALGLTRIRFSHYLLTTFICMLPGAFAYTYLGYVGREAISGADGIIQKGLLALAIVALIAFLPRFIGRLRRGECISIESLRQQLGGANTPLLLDVREHDEFNGEQGHIEGAVNLPLSEFNDRLEELSDYLEQPVALICRAEKRSIKAAAILARTGFGQLQVVNGGMTAWIKAGWPTVREG